MLISFEPIFSIATEAFLRSIRSACSDSSFLRAETVISSSWCSSTVKAMVRNSCFRVSTCTRSSLYETYDATSVYVPSSKPVREKFPSMSVMAPIVVPAICTVAPISGS